MTLHRKGMVWASARGLDGWTLIAMVVALISVWLIDRHTIGIPLYDRSCPACSRHVISIPLVPLIAGWMFGGVYAVWQRIGARKGIVAGTALGITSALYITLLTKTAPIPLNDGYFGTPYRIYALAYTTGVTALLTIVGVSLVRRGPQWARDVVARPLLIAAFLAIVAATSSGAWPIAVAASIGGILGAAAGLARPERWRPARVRSITKSAALLMALLTAAFLSRLLFGLQLLARSGPGMAFAINGDDGDTYYEHAIALASGVRTLDVLANTTYPPGYALFAAGVFAATGENLAVLVTLQALLAAIGALALFGIARDVAGRGAAMVACAFFALDANLIQNASTMNAEAVVLPLLLAGLWTLLRAGATGCRRWFVASGLLLGVAFISRNLAALALVIGVLWSLFPLLRAWRLRQAVSVALLVAAFLIPAIPTAIATTVLEGKPRLTTQVASLAWGLDGNGITIDNTELVARGIDPVLDPLGSVAAIARDPISVVGFLTRAVPDRLATLFFYPNPGLFDPLLLVNPALASPYSHLLELVLIVLTVAGVILCVDRLRGRPALVPIAGFTLLYLGVFVLLFPPFHPFRYRILIVPAALIAQGFAAVVLTRLISRTIEDRMVTDVQTPIA